MTKPLFNDEGPNYYAAAYVHNKPFAKPGPYQTTLSPAEETAFKTWVTKNNVPFDANAQVADYDMRGYWKNTGGGKDWKPGSHFPDTYKTPYDTTFSAESEYATPDCPFNWQEDSLVDSRDGTLIFGDPVPAPPKPAAKPAAQAQPPLTGAAQQQWLTEQLAGQGLTPDEIKGVLAMNVVEGGPTEPRSILGLDDTQGVGRDAKFKIFMGQWNDMSRRPGGQIPGMTKYGIATDWNAYMAWIRAKIMGQTGNPSDFEGHAQPPAQYYQDQLMHALPGHATGYTPDQGSSGSGYGTRWHLEAQGPNGRRTVEATQVSDGNGQTHWKAEVHPGEQVIVISHGAPITLN